MYSNEGCAGYVSCRYYRSCNEDASAKRRGKLPMKKKRKRRHERIARVCLCVYSPASIGGGLTVC